MEIIYRIPDPGDHPNDNVMHRNFMLSFLQIVENAEEPIIFVSIGDIIEYGRKLSNLEIIAVRQFHRHFYFIQNKITQLYLHFSK
jgi:hypothetical protein